MWQLRYRPFLIWPDKKLKFAKEAHLEIAVRGGGHSASGASSSDGGIVIDLSEMREVSVDTTNNLIIAQGGCVWADVDAAGAQHDLVTVGGTVIIQALEA